jgi:hypothetical protein
VAGVNGEDHGNHWEDRDLSAPHIDGGKLGGPGKDRGTHQHGLKWFKTFLGSGQPKGSAERHHKQGDGK